MTLLDHGQPADTTTKKHRTGLIAVLAVLAVALLAAGRVAGRRLPAASHRAAAAVHRGAAGRHHGRGHGPPRRLNGPTTAHPRRDPGHAHRRRHRSTGTDGKRGQLTG